MNVHSPGFEHVKCLSTKYCILHSLFLFTRKRFDATDDCEPICLNDTLTRDQNLRKSFSLKDCL